jgi:beta-lactam-binding protein with PASTA domain
VPLAGEVVLIPAKAGKRPGLVVNQEPRGGHLSANDAVKLFVSHAQNGLVPNLVGSSEVEARAQLERLKLRVLVTTDDGSPGVVLRQSLEPGVASRPGMRIRVVVGRSTAS